MCQEGRVWRWPHMAKPCGAARLRSLLVGRKQGPNIRPTSGDDILQSGFQTRPFGSKFLDY